LQTPTVVQNTLVGWLRLRSPKPERLYFL